MGEKGFEQMMAEAIAAVDGISVSSALGLVNDPEVRFVDVREDGEWAAGHIPGAVHAPRGLLDSIADPTHPQHNAEISQDKTLVLYCAAGGRSMLAAKTLLDMGYSRVCSLTGGLTAWKQADGPIEA